MSGLAYEFLPLVLGWTLLLLFFYDAIFRCVAAAAPDGQQAQTMATPFLVLFIFSVAASSPGPLPQCTCAGSSRPRRRTMLCRPSSSHGEGSRPERAGQHRHDGVQEE